MVERYASWGSGKHSFESWEVRLKTAGPSFQGKRDKIDAFPYRG